MAAGIDWPVTIGVLTGIVGTVTGIAGTIMALIALHRTKWVREVEMRLDLDKAIVTASHTSFALPDLLQRALDSRRAVLAAQGRGNSGAWQALNDEIHQAKAKWWQLHQAVAGLAESSDRQPLESMAATLADVHALQLDLTAMSDKDRAELLHDDETRREIARQHESRLP